MVKVVKLKILDLGVFKRPVGGLAHAPDSDGEHPPEISPTLIALN